MAKTLFSIIVTNYYQNRSLVLSWSLWLQQDWHQNEKQEKKRKIIEPRSTIQFGIPAQRWPSALEKTNNIKHSVSISRKMHFERCPEAMQPCYCTKVKLGCLKYAGCFARVNYNAGKEHFSATHSNITEDFKCSWSYSV